MPGFVISFNTREYRLRFYGNERVLVFSTFGEIGKFLKSHGYKDTST